MKVKKTLDESNKEINPYQGLMKSIDFLDQYHIDELIFREALFNEGWHG